MKWHGCSDQSSRDARFETRRSREGSTEPEKPLHPNKLQKKTQAFDDKKILIQLYVNRHKLPKEISI